MRQVWLFLLMAAVVGVFASATYAQRFPQILNLNTHEGKYDVGGVGLQIGGGYGLNLGQGELHREGPGTKVIDGTLEAAFTRRFAQTHRRIVFGAKLDFQIGSDNDVIGTCFNLEFYQFNISTASAVESGTSGIVIDPGTDPVYTGASESASVVYFGFDFIINFYKSEYLETDGRRTRDNWGLAMIVGPKVSMMMGDFSDLNGISSFGLDIGLVADVPIHLSGAEDLLSLSPFMLFEANYRLGVDTGLVDENPASATFGAEVLNDSFDLGFYGESQEDLDANGLPDYDGIAIRRHNFIPAWQLSLGTTVNLTPIFISRSGGLINNWRFWGSLTLSVPLNLGLFASAYPGDAMWGADELPTVTVTLSVGASYFF
jgi:hypothetical protein